MVDKPRKRIGELLIEEGVLSKESLEEALTAQKQEGGLIGQLLIKLGYVSEEQVVAALGRQLDIPYLPLQNYSVDLDTVRQFEEPFCRKNMLVPFDRDDQYVYIAVTDPLHDHAILEVQKQLGLKAQTFISLTTEISKTLDLAFSASAQKQEKR